MPLSRPYRLTISLLALLAISWAQTFGIHRGWLCDHGDEQFITQVDHCHGAHSAAQHTDEDHSIPHEHHEDDGDTQPLPEVKDSLLAKQQNDTAFHLSAPVSQLSTFDLCETSRQTLAGVRFTTEKPPQRSLQAQHWPRRLAQTIALRI